MRPALAALAFAFACSAVPAFAFDGEPPQEERRDYRDGYRRGYDDGFASGYRKGLEDARRGAAPAAPPPPPAAAPAPRPTGPITVSTAYYGTASITRSRPRAFTAWWWIVLMRVTDAFGYRRASHPHSASRMESKMSS